MYYSHSHPKTQPEQFCIGGLARGISYICIIHKVWSISFLLS